MVQQCTTFKYAATSIVINVKVFSVLINVMRDFATLVLMIVDLITKNISKFKTISNTLDLSFREIQRHKF
jgi:hypothetical protein